MADHHLLLTFDNGERRVFDMRPYLDRQTFAELKYPWVFNSVRVDYDGIVWGNGVGMDDRRIYTQSVPVE